jgi:hypothetical protein
VLYMAPRLDGSDLLGLWVSCTDGTPRREPSDVAAPDSRVLLRAAMRFARGRCYALVMNAPIPMLFDEARSHSGTYVPGKLMWWHDSIIDLMIANPSWTKKDIAHKLGKSAVFIYMITNSDLFHARYTKRRDEYERNLGVGLARKVTEVADKTLDRILSQLSDENKPIPIHHLESLADKTLSRLGYGPRVQPPSPAVSIQADKAQVVVIPAARSDLDEARRLIRDREEQLALNTPSRSESALVHPTLDLTAAPTPTIEDL